MGTYIKDTKLMKEITTTNFADFGYSERKELIKLLTAWNEQGLPDGFEQSNVHPMLNRSSGNVFLTNENFDVAMMNGDKLETWYYCFECGHEGFAEDCQLNDRGCNECNEGDEQSEPEILL